MTRFKPLIAIVACAAIFAGADSLARTARGASARSGRSPSSLGDLAPRTMAEHVAVPQPGFAAPLLETGQRPSLLGEKNAGRRPRLMLQKDRTQPSMGVLSPQYRWADVSLKWQ